LPTITDLTSKRQHRQIDVQIPAVAAAAKHQGHQGPDDYSSSAAPVCSVLSMITIFPIYFLFLYNSAATFSTPPILE